VRVGPSLHRGDPAYRNIWGREEEAGWIDEQILLLRLSCGSLSNARTWGSIVSSCTRTTPGASGGCAALTAPRRTPRLP
jgi:hypothetical protein